jgi:hypothetical protein
MVESKAVIAWHGNTASAPDLAWNTRPAASAAGLQARSSSASSRSTPQSGPQLANRCLVKRSLITYDH